MIWFLFQGGQGPIGKHGSAGFTGDRVGHVTDLLDHLIVSTVVPFVLQFFVGSFFLLVCYSFMFFLNSLFVPSLFVLSFVYQVSH